MEIAIALALAEFAPDRFHARIGRECAQEALEIGFRCDQHGAVGACHSGAGKLSCYRGDLLGHPRRDTQRARGIGFHDRTRVARGSVIDQCNEMLPSVNEVQELSAYLSEVFGCDNVLTRPRWRSSRTRPLGQEVSMSGQRLNPHLRHMEAARARRRDEDRRQRVMVITEFDAGDPDATMHALADEILRYRQALRLLAEAIGWAEAGAPFGFFPLVRSGVRSALARVTSRHLRRKLRAWRSIRRSSRHASTGRSIS